MPRFAAVAVVAVVAVVAILALAAGAVLAGGGPGSFSLQAEPARGAAPLAVSLAATGQAATVHWDFGDGSPGVDGASVSHIYTEPGVYVAAATATLPDGSTARAQVTITALRISLSGPAAVGFGGRATFRGRVEPPLARVPVRLLRGGTVLGGARTLVRR